MNIKLGTIVSLMSSIFPGPTGPQITASLVTAVWPDVSGNTDPNVAPVMVDVTAFPNGHTPTPVQQVRVFALRSQGGNDMADFHGWAFLDDDLADQSIATVHVSPPVRKPLVGAGG